MGGGKDGEGEEGKDKEKIQEMENARREDENRPGKRNSKNSDDKRVKERERSSRESFWVHDGDAHSSL